MNIEEIPSYLKVAEPFIRRLRELSDYYNLSLQEFTVSFLKAIPGDNQIVIGCEAPEQVTENARLIKSVSQMNREIREKLFEKMGDIPDYVINPSLWKVNI